MTTTNQNDETEVFFDHFDDTFMNVVDEDELGPEAELGADKEECCKESFSDMKNEQDVGLKLLEPLLTGLGFKEDDWVKQYSVRILDDKPPRPAGYSIGLRDAPGGLRAEFIFYVKLALADVE